MNKQGVKMKKTSLWAGVLVLLFALPQGYAANQGKVTFSGKVLAARLCNITTETAGKTIDLGRVRSHQFTGEGTTVGGTNFTLSVRNCGEMPNMNNTHRLKYYFVSPYVFARVVNGNFANIQYYLKNTVQDSVNRDSVGIQIFAKEGSEAGKVINIIKPPLPTDTSTGSKYTGTQLGAKAKGDTFDITLTAKFYAVTAGSSDKAGKVASEMTFEVFYE
ncbi:fimbrial protein [Haemophilus influenzae biotype aegyptius]|nr:type 1 fimbrial protein [Haemophilus influenzae biotype aegyptius]CBY80730.1 Fimbrial protein [Haemophilus influenzae F3031]QEQ62937.1 type 1 fimbrial protein [Haemophilus influenzae biotype aegyptius]QEQ65123.1 type 1 fimbrial protein [Haemophilus influenzae biotype aegyptius]TMQ35912.1 fimbrial protein [Haemophilus influenzae biotype aegyptius]